jgi:predicted ATPase/DNA-binding SARP family transcriptional activator
LPNVALHFLGAPHIELDGRSVATDRRKAVALLAYLAVTATPHTRESLATLLWPDYDATRALAYLRRTLWEVNNLLPNLLITEGDQLSLPTTPAVWHDVAAFEAALAQSTSRRFQPEPHPTKTPPGSSHPQPPDHLNTLAHAVTLYRGDFLAGFTLRDSAPFDDWQFFQAERLRQLLAGALASLSAALAEQGDHETAVPHARRWLALDPLHEPAHRQLMHLYAQMGQRSAALRQYQECERILHDEMGLEPSAETQALHQRITRGELDKVTEEPITLSPPHPGLAGVTLSLPATATPFVGRTSEVAEIGRLVSEPDCRLLTLTGPGGSGKTRLSIQTAAQLAQDNPAAFHDGVYFVPLAPLSSSDSLLPTLAKALNFTFYKSPSQTTSPDTPESDRTRQQLLDYLRQKQMLLVLDNFEHLLDEDGLRLPADILATAPGVKLLVTSRSRLNLQGERLYPVAGMRTPDPETAAHWLDIEADAAAYSSIQLFRQSARRVQPAFQLTADNVTHVVHICRLVEGMPLAIELAAAWVELLPPAEIAAEIERSLDFLETEQHGVPERQRSLRAVFNSSWALLTAEERDIFQRLTVFRGGFSREAAADVAGASLKMLLALVNKSWLQRDINNRYHLHELLRQYGQEILQANKATWLATRQRHSRYYATWMNDQSQELFGPRQGAALNALALELENVRAACHWMIEQDQLETFCQRILPSLLRYHVVRYSGEELLPLLEQAITKLSTRPESETKQTYLAVLLTAQVILLEINWEYNQLQQLTRRAWSIVEELGPSAPPHVGFSWYTYLLAIQSWTLGREEGIQRLFDLLPLLRQRQDWLTLAWANRMLGNLLQSVNRRDEARERVTESLTLYQQLGDTYEEANTLAQMGELLRERAAYQEALRYYQEAAGRYTSIGNRVGVGSIVAYALPEIYIQQGRFAEAWAAINDAKHIFMEIGNRRLLVNILHWESLHLLRYGDSAKAKESRQQQLTLAEATGLPNELAWGFWEMGEIARLSGDESLARQWYEGARLRFEQQSLQLGIGFYHRGLGDLALANGEFDKAERRFQVYRQMAELSHYYWSVAYAHSGLGRAATGLGRYHDARTHFRESLRLVVEIGNRDLAMLPLAGLAALLAAENQPEQAATLAAFVHHHYLTWHETRTHAATTLTHVTPQLPPDVAAAAEARGKTAELDQVVAQQLNG